MKKIVKLILRALMIISVFAFVSCGNESVKNPNESGTNGKETDGTEDKTVNTETDSETETKAVEAETDSEELLSDGYLNYYSDNEAARRWLESHILNTEKPPLTFEIDGRASSELNWVKTDRGETPVTDYADTDDPVTRYVRTIVYTCSDAGLEITLSLTGYPDYPVVEYDAVMKNISKENSGEIKNVCSINAELGENDKTVLHYSKGTLIEVNDYEPYTTELKMTAFHLETNLGQPCDAFLPYFNFENQSKGGVIAAVNWQGDWSADMFIKNGNNVLKAGQYNCDFVLYSDEEYRFPGTVLLFYRNGDWQFGQNVWRRWIIRHNLMRYTGGRDYTHNVFACSTITRSAADIAAIKQLAEVGLGKDYNVAFEIDAGWYVGGEDDWVHVGNWTPSSKYGADGLRKVSDACHDAGIDFCLWMEPERLFYGTELANELGDGAIYLYNTGGYVPYNRYNASSCMPWGVVNYGMQKTVDTLVKVVDNVIKTYGVDIYRQDFNTHYYQFWHQVDDYTTKRTHIARYGMTENHACSGYLEFLHRIFELNPDILFDACAAGGRRYDLETMRFGFMHTKSDFVHLAPQINKAEVVEQCQNFSTSWWYIMTGTGLSNGSDEYVLRTYMCRDVAFLAKDVKNHLKALKEWKKNTAYMFKDYYALTEYSLEDDAELAMQFNDHENGEGMAVAYLRAGGEFTFKLMGLERNATYKVWDTNKKSSSVTLTGTELMSAGYKVKRNAGTRAAVIINYEKTD